MSKYFVKGFGKSRYPVKVKDSKELNKLKSIKARLFDSEKEAKDWIREN